MDTGAIVRVATAGSGGYVGSARISADGRYVTFQSDADDLVAGDHNNSYDIFRKDMLTGAIERLSTTTWRLRARCRQRHQYQAAGERGWPLRDVL